MPLWSSQLPRDHAQLESVASTCSSRRASSGDAARGRLTSKLLRWYRHDSNAQSESLQAEGRWFRVPSCLDTTGSWGAPIVTEIVAATDYWKAEEEHQDYLEKNPGGYTCHFLRPESVLGDSISV